MILDSINLILTALAGGAGAGIKDVASQGLRDAYNGLKTLVARRFTNKPEAAMALAKYEENPEVWEAPLRAALIETGTDQDEVIVQAAQHYLTLMNPQQAAMGKYNVHITGPVQGFVQGDHSQVHMTFGNPPSNQNKGTEGS